MCIKVACIVFTVCMYSLLQFSKSIVDEPAVVMTVASVTWVYFHLLVRDVNYNYWAPKTHNIMNTK